MLDKDGNEVQDPVTPEITDGNADGGSGDKGGDPQPTDVDELLRQFSDAGDEDEDEDGEEGDDKGEGGDDDEDGKGDGEPLDGVSALLGQVVNRLTGLEKRITDPTIAANREAIGRTEPQPDPVAAAKYKQFLAALDASDKPEHQMLVATIKSAWNSQRMVREFVELQKVPRRLRDHVQRLYETGQYASVEQAYNGLIGMAARGLVKLPKGGKKGATATPDNEPKKPKVTTMTPAGGKAAAGSGPRKLSMADYHKVLSDPTDPKNRAIYKAVKQGKIVVT